ncbi:cytochrome P450 [Hyaloscypha sp. PMI_1271]|nr:cytochrome P450 [Hyaloscypha sp. PMI_1271]
MDDFYESAPSSGGPLLSSIYRLSPSFGAVLTLLLAPFAIAIATRLLSGRPSEKVSGRNERTVSLLPYSIPVIGHAFSFLYDPINLMIQARDKSPHGIFALYLGSTTHNVISDPALVSSVMAQRESVVEFAPIAWNIVQKWFGFPKSSKTKYEACWREFSVTFSHLMKEPYLNQLLKPTIRNLEENIPQMISFTDSEIDQQLWERWAKTSCVSDSECELNLMSLMRDMMGHASVPAIFGRALMEKYPNLLHDVYDLDSGFYFFLMGLPAWTPWPGVMTAHVGRHQTGEALNDLQRALDALVDGNPIDPSWGELDDVSGFIMERHAIFKNHDFEINERGDISILWASVANANLFVYWQLLFILSTPGLVDRIREEVAGAEDERGAGHGAGPSVAVTKPVSIGSISESPKLKISHEGLLKKCPLLKSTYLEALRMTDQPWSVRKVAQDVVIKGDKKDISSPSFLIHKGEYITIPHDLHMRDPKYFKDPEKFDPERFLVQNGDGTLSANAKTIRPFGGGPSMCQGRALAEAECLALVAGVLMFWDIEPADKNAGWVIPKQVKTTAISRPAHDTRVRIKRRRFDWGA